MVTSRRVSVVVVLVVSALVVGVRLGRLSLRVVAVVMGWVVVKGAGVRGFRLVAFGCGRLEEMLQFSVGICLAGVGALR